MSLEKVQASESSCESILTKPVRFSTSIQASNALDETKSEANEIKSIEWRSELAQLLNRYRIRAWPFGNETDGKCMPQLGLGFKIESLILFSALAPLFLLAFLVSWLGIAHHFDGKLASARKF